MGLGSLAVGVLGWRRVVHVAQAQLLVGGLRRTIVNDCGGARVVCMVCLLCLIEPPQFSAILLIASRVHLQLLQIEFLGRVVLVKGFILLDQMVAVVRASGVEEGVLVVCSDSLLDAILKAHLGVVDRVGEGRRRSCLDPCLLVVLEDIAGADDDAIVVQVPQ